MSVSSLAAFTDFVINTRALAADVNAKLDAIEAWSQTVASFSGSVPIDDLADGSSGQLIVCNASGVPQYRALTGAVSSVSATGLVTLGHTAKEGTPTPLAIDNSTWTTIANCVFTPPAGTYLVLGSFTATASVSSMSALHGRIRTSGGTNIAEASLTLTAASVSQSDMSMHDTATFNGSTQVDLQAVCAMAADSASAGFGRLTFLQLA